jgi:hypothetical protein
MIILGTSEPVYETVPLGPPGVALVMRPATTLDRAQAESAVADMLEAINAGRDIAALYGLPVPVAVAQLEQRERRGLIYAVTLVELGLLLIREWQGIGTASGDPAPIDRIHLWRLFQHVEFARRFEAMAFRTVIAMADEGNAFAPSSPGGRAVALDSAPAAGSTTSPAPPVH